MLNLIKKSKKQRPLVSLKKLKTLVKPSFWRLFYQLNDINFSKSMNKNQINDCLFKLKENIYNNKLNVILKDKLKQYWVQLMRSSFRGHRVGGFLKPGFLRKVKRNKLSFKLNKFSVKWGKQILFNFIPFTYKKFINKFYFSYNNNDYWRIIVSNDKNSRKFLYFVFSKGILYQWPFLDNRRRKQRFMNLIGYKIRKFNFFSNLKFYSIKFGKIASKSLKMYNKAKFQRIDLINLYSKFSSLVFKELVMLFFFWLIYYFSSFYFLYVKVLISYGLFLF